MSKIILINGKKRHGKDFIAAMLKDSIEELGSSAEIMSFAEPMKNIISTIFGISLEDLDEYKNNPNQVTLQLFDNYNEVLVTDFRAILQKFGSEAMKPIFGENVWHDLLIKRADKSEADYILVPDFRFPVEDIDEAIKVKVFNDDIKSDDTHTSETSLDDFKFDYYINNTSYSFKKEHADYFIKTHLKVT